MTTFTANDVRDLTTVSVWPIRKCSVCGDTLYYEFPVDPATGDNRSDAVALAAEGLQRAIDAKSTTVK